MKKNQESEPSVLVDAAKAIGRTAGKVAVLVGAAHSAAPAKRTNTGKLQSKGKHRLPRREKKAKLRAAALPTS